MDLQARILTPMILQRYFIPTLYISVVEVDHEHISGVRSVAPVKHLKRVEVRLRELVVVDDDRIEEEDSVVLSDGEAVDVGELGWSEARNHLQVEWRRRNI